MAVGYVQDGSVVTVTIDRPDRRNAVDLDTANQLLDAFKTFDEDPHASVAILTGAEGNFCAGADLQAIAAGERKPIKTDGEFAPMGPTRLRLSKPVVAAIEGYAVAGGLELALWADLRVASATAVFGVFCRRFGVPLVDLGTFRLPRLIGQSRASDMILTGREVRADEALGFGLINRKVEAGKALESASVLASELAAFPQQCLRNDLASMRDSWGVSQEEAMTNEIRLGLQTIASGETVTGAGSFAHGAGRHGSFER